MALNGTDLYAAVKAATSAIERPGAGSTQEEIEAYVDAVGEAQWSALVAYLVANAEITGDVDAGIEVEDGGASLIGTTRTGTNKINGGIT